MIFMKHAATSILTSVFLFPFPVAGGIRQNSKNSVYKYQYGAIGSIRSVFKKGGAALFTSVANTFFSKSVITEKVTYGTPNAMAFFLIFPMCFFTFHSFGAVA